MEGDGRGWEAGGIMRGNFEGEESRLVPVRVFSFDKSPETQKVLPKRFGTGTYLEERGDFSSCAFLKNFSFFLSFFYHFLAILLRQKPIAVGKIKNVKTLIELREGPAADFRVGPAAEFPELPAADLRFQSLGT